MAWHARILMLAFACAAAGPAAVADSDAGRELRAGLAAAAAQNFVEAAAHFQFAHRADPESSLILYNMGLAEAEIPGREPRAMCWLAAFIAAQPDVENTASIVAKIDELQALSRNNIARLIALTREAGNRAPDERAEYRNLVAYRTAALWIEAGDMARAEELLPTLPAGSAYESSIKRAIAGDTLLVNEKVEFKADNKEAGYRLAYNEPYSAWSRFVRWVESRLGQGESEDEDRAAAWTRACNGTALSQPLFTDQTRHLRGLAENYVDHGEWSASIGLARDITDAAAEVIYVHNAKTYEIGQ